MRYLFCLDIKVPLPIFIVFNFCFQAGKYEPHFYRGPVSFGLALLFNATVNCFAPILFVVKIELAFFAYEVHIQTSLPLLHFGHSVMSLPYFSSIRWLTGICTFGGKAPKCNCALMALSRFILP